MPLTRYGFSRAVSGSFEFPTDNARRVLPAHLEPVELHHGTSVLSVTVFDFNDSLVGAYREVVISVMVAPLVRRGEKLPKAAFYPFQVATTTKASRDHAIERWHLPHWMDDVEIALDQDGSIMNARVAADGDVVLEMTISEHSWERVVHLYQSFMKDGDEKFLAYITIDGTQSEHEEETGRLRLADHPFNKDLMIGEVSEIPFREQWVRDGVQIFQPLVQLETA
jgi:hypothetical protein